MRRQDDEAARFQDMVRLDGELPRHQQVLNGRHCEDGVEGFGRKKATEFMSVPDHINILAWHNVHAGISELRRDQAPADCAGSIARTDLQDVAGRHLPKALDEPAKEGMKRIIVHLAVGKADQFQPIAPAKDGEESGRYCRLGIGNLNSARKPAVSGGCPVDGYNVIAGESITR